MSIISEAMPHLAEMAERGATLSIAEAAEIVEVKPATVRSYIFVGRRGHHLQAYRLGSRGRLRTTAAALLRFLEATATQGGGDG